MTGWCKRLALLGWLVWLLMPASGACAMPLDPAAERVPLWPILQAVADPHGQHTPAQIAALVAAGHAQGLPHPDHAFGNWRPYPYWAQFSLSNPQAEAQSWLLTYELPTQDEARLWVQNARGDWVEHPLLEHQRPQAGFAGVLYPTWRLKLQGHQAVNLMLRIDGYNLMRFPLHAVSDDHFVRTQGQLHLWIGVVLAVPLVVVLYVLTLIPVAADRSLPLFLAMAACEMLGSMWVCGVLPQLLPWLDRWQAGWLGWSGYVGMLGLSALHARVFLGTREDAPLADRLLLVGAWIWLAAVPAIAFLWPDTSRRMLVMGGSLHAFAMLCIAWHHQRKRPQKHRLLFLAVWAVYAFSGLLYVLYRLIQLPIHVTLISNFVQGSLVAALLGCAVSVQIIRKRNVLKAGMQRAHERSLFHAAAQHDLMQPLQSVSLYVQALRHAPPRQRDELMRGIDDAMRSVDDFMLGMRQLSLDEPPAPDLRAVNLHSVLEPVVQEFRQWTQGRHITLRYQRVDRPIRTDVATLQRIVRNLLSNALRYTEDGGRILIGCRRRQGRLWLMVIDNGIGMNEADAARCFDAFQRGGTPTRVPEGMGLGLYSVKRLSELLGMAVTLKSVEGKGTVVGVSLAEDAC